MEEKRKKPKPINLSLISPEERKSLIQSIVEKAQIHKEHYNDDESEEDINYE